MPDIWAEASVLWSKLYYLLRAKLEMPYLTKHNLLNASRSWQIERGCNTCLACIFLFEFHLCGKTNLMLSKVLLVVRCQDIRCLIWNLIFISAVISLAIKDRFFFPYLLNNAFVSCSFFKKQEKCFYLIFKFILISELFHANDTIQECTKNL